jgi:glycosyltransferase involved in cell wall biosynthesis
MARVAIDMTPLLPGGTNGGVRLLALEIVKGFQEAAKNSSFLILTASWNHEELSALDAPNTERLCVLNERGAGVANVGTSALSTGFINRAIKAYYLLPHSLRRLLLATGVLRQVGSIVTRCRHSLEEYFQKKPLSRGILSAHEVDVLFCPFTAPTLAESGIPTVCLICDLQHKDYPQFFTFDEVNTRESFYKEVRNKADAIICISEFTRESVIKYLQTQPDRTHVIHVCIQSRLHRSKSEALSPHLQFLHLDRFPYMFYPANFWRHKNHQLLFASYGIFVSNNPEKRLDLVLTGTLDDTQKELRKQVKCMGLEHRVHFLGYLNEDELISVWKKCLFLIFPSLYEGFGIPVLEAMQFGKPVLCGNTTSLPEVAGSAALYFDPRKPAELAQCIERIATDPQLYDDLVTRGYRNLERFQFQDMIDAYLRRIEALTGPQPFSSC